MTKRDKMRRRVACWIKGHDLHEDKPYQFRCRRCHCRIVMSDIWASS